MTNRFSPGQRGGAAQWLSLLAATAIAGCAELLPKASSEVASAWGSFDQARGAIEKVVPYRTSVQELKALGIDPYASPNVQLLTFSDIVLRFPIGANLPVEKLDRGLRECLLAGIACTGYSVSIKDIKRDRVGNFWLDALSFHRETDIRGWSFNALVLVVEDKAVYVIHGGQPMIRERETVKQPLGPLQGWGDMVPGMIR